MFGIILFLEAATLGVFLVRNIRVYRYRSALISQVKPVADADIAAGRPWKWRYMMFKSISYDRMVLQFWRPLQSFGLEAAVERQREVDHAPE